jgi:hypothetical protein
MEAYLFEIQYYSITSGRLTQTLRYSPEDFTDDEYDLDDQSDSACHTFLQDCSEDKKESDKNVRAILTIQHGNLSEDSFISNEDFELTLISNKYLLADNSSYEALKDFSENTVAYFKESYPYWDGYELVAPEDFNLEQYKEELQKEGLNDFGYNLSDDRFGGADSEEELKETIKNYLSAHEAELERPRRGRSPIHGWREFLDISAKYGKEIIRVFHSSGNITGAYLTDTPIQKFFDEAVNAKKIHISSDHFFKVSDSLWSVCDESDFGIFRREAELRIDGYLIGLLYTHFEDSNIRFDEDITEAGFRAFVQANNNAINWNEKTKELAHKFGVELPEVAVLYPTMR